MAFSEEKTPELGPDDLPVAKGCLICLMLLALVVFRLVIFFVYFGGDYPEVTATNASLTQFSYTISNHTLSYNLAVNISIRNPNRVLRADYRAIQVIARYLDERFAVVTLNHSALPFYQGPKKTNTTILQNVVVQGQQVLLLDASQLSKFDSETVARVYSIEVMVYARLRMGLSKFFIRTLNLKPNSFGATYFCKLKVPLDSRGFETTAC